MDDNNQILDVTYGKFSCRLEGFEDSVETMKLVVSFFHDMAGHDAFMDTADLAPDMETLARLTEEQTGQSIDIDTTESKLSLRVRPESVDEEEVTASDDVDEDPVSDDFGAEFDAPDQDPAPIETMLQTEEDEEDLRASELSGVADKLKRMRAAAERKRVEPQDDYAEDLSEPATPPVANPLTQRLSELAKRTMEEERNFAAANNRADAVDTDAVSDDDQLTEQEEALEDDDLNVFSDLSAETAEEEAPASVEDDAVAEDTTDDDADEDTDDIALADADDALANAPQTDAEDAIDWDTDDVPQGDVVAADPFDQKIADVTLEEDDAELDAFLAAEDAKFAASKDEDAIEVDSNFATDEDDDEVEYAAEEPADDAAEKYERPHSDEAPLVLTSDDVASDYDDDLAADEDGDYNDDDEFDLEKEVAKVEAEIAARKGNEFARRGLPRHVEDAMSRIMSQTDQHLNQPENRRHRDAFAQLKAAVAATEAARQLGDKGTDKRDPDEAYKDDLGAHDANEKGESKATPPLKLVKSQEVKPEAMKEDGAEAPQTSADEKHDAAEPASARLRQIATQIEAAGTDDNGGFAAFAAAHGATDLADQLEAAGAFICLVEGENDFSRPQVMKVVQSASDAEISREDGLRSFGRLLRQARLVKLSNGRFQVAENTQFRPDGHKAAQG